METRNPQELAEGLHHYLTGYGRGEPDKLKMLIAYDHWQEIARNELQRRAHEVITRLDAETLHAIANCEVLVERVARDVLREMNPKQ